MDFRYQQFKERLSNVKFELHDKELHIGKYESISAEMFFTSQHEEKRNKIIIHPGGDVITIIAIIITAFSEYIRNMIDPGNNILEHLNVGDLVEVDGYRARYDGMDNDRIILHYLDGTTSFPVEQSYRIARYSGSASTINKMPTKKGAKAKVTKHIIASIFDIDTKELSNIIKYSTVFIASKEKVYDIVRGLKIVYGGKKYDITSIFPLAYYSSADCRLDFAGNSTRIEPIIKFASKISTARELIQNSKDIKCVTIMGEEFFKSNPTELDWILKRRSIESTNIILQWGKMTNIEGLLNNTENLEVYAWSKNAIKSNIKLYTTNSYEKKISHISYIQDEIINNFLNKDISLKTVGIGDEFEEKIVVCRKFLREISNSIAVDEKKDEFLKLSYTLLNLYEKSCFPLKILENMIEEESLIGVHPKQVLVKLDEIVLYLSTFVNDSTTNKKVKYIVENLNFLREQLYETNLKWDELIKVIRKSRLKKIMLVLYKAYFIDVMRKCCTLNNIPLDFSMNTINKFNPTSMYDTVLLTGVYQGKNFDIINNSYTDNIIILSYKEEVSLFEWIQKKSNYVANKLDRLNKLVEYREDKNEPSNDEDINDSVNDLIEIENIINDIIRRQGVVEGNFNGGATKTECIKVAIFESGEKAYFSKYFLPNKLDRDCEEIKDVKIEDLSIGDELVFKKDEKDMDKDIIQDIIEKLMENIDFRRQYDESLRLSRYWKYALDSFMQKNNVDDNYISSQLLKFNVIRSPMAISTWLRTNKTTAPDKEEVYYALANIIQDNVFMEKWKDVFKASSLIRKLQMRLKKYLGKCIVKSVVKESKTDFDKIVERCVGDVSKLAQIVQIEQLYDVEIEIPVHMANKLIEI